MKQLILYVDFNVSVHKSASLRVQRRGIRARIIVVIINNTTMDTFRRELTYKYGVTQIGLSPTYGTGPFFDTGDTAWMLASTALVLFMTLPGLALFYGGMVILCNN